MTNVIWHNEILYCHTQSPLFHEWSNNKFSELMLLHTYGLVHKPAVVGSHYFMSWLPVKFWKKCCITNKKITKFISALVLHTFHTNSNILKMCTLGGIFIIQHQNWSNDKLQHLLYDVKTNKCT